MEGSFWSTVHGDIVEAPLHEIRVIGRFRKDLGDLSGLSRSMLKVGVLNPILVTKDGRLICGERRLQAAREAEMSTVPCRVLNISELLQAEHDENFHRKELSDSEKVELAQAIEAELGERRGRVNPNNHEETRGLESAEIAAKAAGFGNTESYRQARRVVRHGSPALVAAVDNSEVARAEAAEISSLPKDEQEVLLRSGLKAVKAQALALKAARRGKANRSLKTVAKFAGLRITRVEGKFHLALSAKGWREEMETFCRSRAAKSHLVAGIHIVLLAK